MKIVCFVFLMLSLSSFSQEFLNKKIVIEQNDSTVSRYDRELLSAYSLQYESSKSDTYRIRILSQLVEEISGQTLNSKIVDFSISEIKEKISTSTSKAKKNVLKSYWAQILGNHAYFLIDEGKYAKAVTESSKAIEIAKSIDDVPLLISLYLNVGYIYQLQEDFPSAKAFFLKSARLAEKMKSNPFLSDAYVNLAAVYYSMESIDSAIFYCHKCLAVSSDLKESYTLLAAYNNLGHIYLNASDYIDSADFYFSRTIDIANRGESPYELYTAKSSRISILLMKNNLQEAEKEAQETIELIEEIGDQVQLAESIGILSEIKKKLGKYDEALDLRNQEIEILQRLSKKEDLTAMAELKAKLKYENEIEVNKVKAENAEKSATQKTAVMYGVIAVLAVILVLVVLLLLNRSKLRKKQLHLEELDKINKQIFSVISHDFKEPIISFNLLLKDIEKDEKLDQSSLNDMKSQIKSSSDVLSNLLNWAKSELDRQEIRKEKFGLKEMLDRIIGSIEANAKKKSLIVTNNISDDEVMIGDVAMLEIVFRNILSNAIKYSPEGGRVAIRQEGGIIQISDQGSGISSSVQSSLFKEKVIPSYGTAGESGFGIGLFIVANLLKKNGKVISYSGNAPKGTIFNIQDAAN